MIPRCARHLLFFPCKYRRFASLICAISSRNFTMRSLTGFSADDGLVVRGVIMDYVRSNLLFNLVAVDEFICNEPDFWVDRVVAEEKCTPNHLVND